MKLAERRGGRIAAREPSAKLAAEPTSDHRGAALSRSTGMARRAGEVLQSVQSGDDGFHLNSLVGQIWLVQLREYTEAQYAQPAGAPGQALQTGFAWGSFSKIFEPLSPIELVRLFENLLRFANFDGFPPARAFFLAYAPLSFEHDVSGEYIGPGVWNPQAGPRNATARVRRTLKRWCQWMEALVHFQVHEQHHALSTHRHFDKLIILLWPIALLRRWSYLDLLNLLRSLATCGTGFPYPSQTQLADYCSKVLRLNLPGPATSTHPLSSADQLVAGRLFKFLPAIR